MSVTELGFGAAIAYALYAPLHAGDTRQIGKLMKMYRRVYRRVACVIVLIGLLCMPFLGFLIKDVPDIRESLQVIFFLFVVKAASSYLLVYKATLLEANQQKNIVHKISIVYTVCATAVEAVVLIVSQEYLLYLALSIGLEVLKNITISKAAQRRFPELREVSAEELS
jgi:hypothetical protein